ncbi:cellulose synthase complex periplasmic endoglucanase BcsZ [Castellaniella sp.]|uniref:cellulose synthase complex periplasmic endoglucanase BcsZ n=1 Tax=Castellaniella sp. TaxID=1955812 RepID=UPI003A8E03F9
MLTAAGMSGNSQAAQEGQAAAALQCTEQAAWSHWEIFRQQAISSDGRVIDHSDSRQITTSEGQAYGLFFALVNSDEALFRRLLSWSERHLASGDLTGHLPAWLWGRQADGQFGVLDDNSASDADVWMAYALIEAGRLWDEHSYAALGLLLMQRIAREEALDAPGLGWVLLGGREGFVHGRQWTVNPSYMTPQIYQRFAEEAPSSAWVHLNANLKHILLATAPNGYAPDWAVWSAENHGWADVPKGAQGSYDAVRVYLWIGMLADHQAEAKRLKRHYRRVESLVGKMGQVPQHINIFSGDVDGEGPAGFSAALLPLLRAAPVAPALHQRMAEIRFDSSNYYDQVLALFAEGWLQKRYWFDESGRLHIGGQPCSED